MTAISTRLRSERSYQEILYFALAVLSGILIVSVDALAVVVVSGFLLIGLLSFTKPVVALIFLLTLAPARTLIATESPIALPLDIGQMLFLFFIGVWLSRHIMSRQTPLRLPALPVVFALVGFIVLTALTVFNATSLSHWLTEWFKWVIAFVMLVYTINSKVSYSWLVFALTVAGVAQAIVGIYIFFGGSGADHLMIPGDFFRAFGTFGQPNPFGGFMGIIAPLTLMMTLGYTHLYLLKSRDIRYLAIAMFYAIASVIIVSALIASWSRGAWLGFVASSTIVLVALPRRTWQNVIVLLVLAVLGSSVLISGILPAIIAERLTSAVQDLLVIRDVRGVFITIENYAVIERLAHWQTAIAMTTDHPWLGVGMGNYDVAYANYSLLNWPLSLQHAHNYYLNVLGEAGIIGLAGYLALFVTIFASSWHARTHPDIISRYIVIGLIGTWTYLSIHSFLDNLYVNNVFIHVGVMLGLLVALHRDVSGKTGFKVI
ncbi:MAG: O-antigen ligase family protein [Anaerolineaceae bacterium]|nr:MAG: O-antigen ligase family protein [Anaerolineaceae bacterium]